jgi:hypothetical protein
MTDQSTNPGDETAEFASVAQAGEPQRADTPDSRQADRPPPTRQELDEREARVTRPRKPMGPSTGIPESVPDEQ